MTTSGHGGPESGTYTHPLRSAPSELNVTSFLIEVSPCSGDLASCYSTHSQSPKLGYLHAPQLLVGGLDRSDVDPRTQSKMIHLRGYLHPLQLHKGVDRGEDVIGLRPYLVLVGDLANEVLDFNDLWYSSTFHRFW
jgi:hypothetical protein